METDHPQTTSIVNVASNNQLQCTIALAALEGVIDPEIGLNVVDLGLIYAVDFQAQPAMISVRMTLTTRFCPMSEAITSAVEQVLHETFPGPEINIALTFDPPWTHARISDRGKEFLNL